MRTCRFHFPRLATVPRALLMAALLTGSAWAAPAHDIASPARGVNSSGSQDEAFDDSADTAKAQPLPWNQLDAAQREMLAPLQSQWDQLPPRRQQRMAEHAEHWNQLPTDRREKIQQHLERWAQMTPEQRRDAARNEHAFQSMAPADRQRVQEAFHRFQSLTPAQRRMLIQRFRAERHGMHEPQAERRPRD